VIILETLPFFMLEVKKNVVLRIEASGENGEEIPE